MLHVWKPPCSQTVHGAPVPPCSLQEERNYILQMVKKIKASGANVLLIQKSILRDAVTDLSLHYLVGGLCAGAGQAQQELWVRVGCAVGLVGGSAGAAPGKVGGRSGFAGAVQMQHLHQPCGSHAGQAGPGQGNHAHSLQRM